MVRKPFHGALICNAGSSLRQPISPGKKLLFQGEQEEEDVLMPAAILPLPQLDSEKPVCISAVEKSVRRKHKPSFPAMVEWSIIKERDKYSV